MTDNAEAQRWKNFPNPWRTLGPQMADAVRAAARGEPLPPTPFHPHYREYRPGRKPGQYKRRRPVLSGFSGTALRRRRENAGYSQSGLAYLIGTAQGRVSAWELGASQPSADRLDKIATILNCLVSDLFDSQ